MVSSSAREALASLESRINALLPPQYVGCFEDVPAASMGSAALKYDKEGKVAWGAIWTTFCHLALAGGPPHRGRFLPAVSTDDALAAPEEQAAVVTEIKRALRLSCALLPTAAEPPGWVGIECDDEDMADWLVRAIVAENVAARREGDILLVPAGPKFRIEKEIKNVVVCVAKCSHYLLDHMEPNRRPRGLAHVVGPPLPDETQAEIARHRAAAATLESRIGQFATVADCAEKSVELAVTGDDTSGWLGLTCTDDEIATWLMRAIVAGDVLARREENVLYVPVPMNAKEGDLVIESLETAIRCWRIRAAAKTDD